MKRLGFALLLGGCTLYFDGGGPGPATVDAGRACSDPAPGCVYGTCDGGTTDICNSECLGVAYGCEDGRWVPVAWCDPPIVDAAPQTSGPMTLELSLASQAGVCPTLDVPPQRTITIVDEIPRTLTVDPPMALTAGTVSYLNDAVLHVHADVTDDWGNGVTPSITFDTDIAAGGPYSSTATGTVGDCQFTLSVTAYFGGV